MACDICGHTVRSVGATDRPTFWCPRCGALKILTGNFHTTEPPKLVERARAAILGAEPCAFRGKSAYAISPSQWLSLCESIAVGEHMGGQR